jgi:hypothetical protein
VVPTWYGQARAAELDGGWGWGVGGELERGHAHARNRLNRGEKGGGGNRRGGQGLKEGR